MLISVLVLVHLIVPGDTLSELAVQYDTTVPALVAANGIADPDLIYAGDELVIPGTGTQEQAAAVEPAATVGSAEGSGMPPQPAPPTTSRSGVDWDAVAQCESGGNWHIDAYHDGGLQFLPATWDAYGGREFAPYAHQATREQQIIVAQRVLAGQGGNAWPVCFYRQ